MSEITGKIHRLNATKLIRPMTTAYWNSLRQAHRERKPIAWGAGVPMLISDAMNIPTHFMGGYASFCAGSGGAEYLLNAAEEDGFLRESCSYHRMHMGDIAIIKRGEQVREELFLPPPDIMILGRLCTEHSHYAEALYRQYHMPVVAIDIPVVLKEEDFEDAVAFTERQLKEEAVPELERFCGRPFDYDRLSELIAIIKESCRLRKECWKLAQHIPAPCTFMDLMVTHGAVLYGIGPHQIEIFQKFKEELEERVAQNVSAVEPEKYRLLFDGIFPWEKMSFIAKLMAKYCANFLVGRYTHEMWPTGDMLKPEEPLYTIAEQMVCHWGQVIMPSVIGGERLMSQQVQDFSIDGVVIHHIITCRYYSMGQQDMLDAMDKKFNVPGILIEGDMSDPYFFSEAGFETKLQALLEIIDARRDK